MRRWTNREGGAPLRVLYIIWHCQDEVFLQKWREIIVFLLTDKGFCIHCHFSIPNCEGWFFLSDGRFFLCFFFAQKHGDLVIFRPFHRESPSKSIPTMKKGWKKFPGSVDEIKTMPAWNSSKTIPTKYIVPASGRPSIKILVPCNCWWTKSLLKQWVFCKRPFNYPLIYLHLPLKGSLYFEGFSTPQHKQAH